LAKLERAKKLARSKMAQAAAKRRSSEKRFNLQTAKLREINEQLEKCRIRAKRPGLVVYTNIENWRGDDQIREGAMVRNRQDLIEIPDLSEMAVKVKVHEASIKLVRNGQKAKIKVDAFPDEELTGEVVQVDILPDSEDRWMNPDVKKYETKIRIEGSHDWVKPGMSAQVELLVKELSDVVYVPIQAVVPADGEKVCYVVRSLGSRERRVIEVGDFNNEFIEIKSGLSEGEEVLLRAPVEIGRAHV
jgi:RND family efflux transporter MFP subunit